MGNGGNMDLTYIDKGMFTHFFADSEAGAQAWREMAEHASCAGNAAVLSIHLKSTLQQLRKAGYKVCKAKPDNTSLDDIFKQMDELGL